MGRAHFRAKFGLSTLYFSIVDTLFFAQNLGVINDKLKLGIELSGVANGLGIVLDENDEFRFVADLFASPQNLPDNV
jgi:hypothetical protein